MTPAEYAQMKRDTATRAGRPIRRLCCKTIATLPYAPGLGRGNLGHPELQWFWFENDDLVTQASVGRTSRVTQYRITDMDAFVYTVATCRTTVVVPERSDLDRILAMITDRDLHRELDLWASFPISRHVVILTEALTLRYWAPPWVNTARYEDWARAFDEHNEKPAVLNDFVALCRVTSYPDSDAPKYPVSAPDVAESTAVTTMEEHLDRTPLHEAALRHLYAEQIMLRWSEAEMFDPINVEQAVCTGTAAEYEPQGRSYSGESGWVPASADMPLNIGEAYWLLTDEAPYDRIETALFEVDRGGPCRPTDRLIKVRYPGVVVVVNSLLIARPGDDFIEGGYASGDTDVSRWEAGSSTQQRVGSSTTEIPLDVILAGGAR